MEQWTGSKLGQGYVKAIYCPPAYLFNLYAEYLMRNARLSDTQAESTLPGEISTALDTQMIPI